MKFPAIDPPRQIELAPGDILGLITDGVFERENPAGNDVRHRRGRAGAARSPRGLDVRPAGAVAAGRARVCGWPSAGRRHHDRAARASRRDSRPHHGPALLLTLARCARRHLPVRRRLHCGALARSGAAPAGVLHRRGAVHQLHQVQRDQSARHLAEPRPHAGAADRADHGFRRGVRSTSRTRRSSTSTGRLPSGSQAGWACISCSRWRPRCSTSTPSVAARSHLPSRSRQGETGCSRFDWASRARSS